MRADGPGPRFVTVARSAAETADAAVREAAAQIDARDTCFVLAFAPEGSDLPALASALDAALSGVPVFGCSTAGQITPQGYETGALLLLAFPKAHFRCASMPIEPLAPLSIPKIAAAARRHAGRFRHTAGWNRLALIFSDGLSKQEDLLVSALETVLEGLPIFGGSAADGLLFEQTFVLHRGRFRSNAAVLLLLETDLQFQGLGVDHFLPGETRMVITHANPENRLVYEINGAPAAQEYARLVGCAVDELSPQIFAENPMLVRHNMTYYVRAVSDVSDSHALSFLAAIDDGLIMTLGRGQEIVETLEAGLNLYDAQGRAPDFILGFDCVLRKLEIEQKQLGQAVSGIFRSRRVLGFNTFGEQHCGVHMNQTFVGVAFFEPQPGHLH